MPPRFLAVCLNPTIQKTLVFDTLKNDKVNRATTVRTDAAGKGVDVARVLAQRGAEVVHLTHAGGPNRDWFLSLCAGDGLAVRWADSGSPIRFCTTVIDASAGSVTELVEESEAVSAGTEARLLDLFNDLIRETDVLILSGSKAGGYSPAVMPKMAEAAETRGILTILDLRGPDLVACLPFSPRVVKPNLDELLATMPPSGQESLRNHAGNIAGRWKRDYGTDLVVTRGGEAVWFAEDGRNAEEEVPAVRLVNPTGSGDAFTAGLAHALASGAGLREAVREGILMGSRNAGVLKPGSISS